MTNISSFLTLLTCTLCTRFVNAETTFRIDAQRGYYYPVSQTMKKVALLDHKNNLSSYYDGDNGDCILLTYETGKGYFLSGKDTDLTWHSAKVSLDEYYAHPTPPKKLWQEAIRKGTEFHLSNMRKEHAEKLAQILAPFSSEYGDQCKAPFIAAHISKITSDGFKHSLKHFETASGSIETKYRGDLKWLVGVFQGFRYFFEPFPRGVDFLNEKKVSLRLDQMLILKTPFHFIIYFLDQLSPGMDLGPILQKRFNSPVEFLTLLQKLGGEVEYGHDGFINVVAEIIKFVHGRGSKEDFIVVLTKFFDDKRGTDDNLEQIWTTSVNDFYASVKRHKLEEAFGDLTKMLSKITEGKWCEHGVDMTGLLGVLLRERRPGDGESVVKVLKALEKKCGEDALYVNDFIP